MNLAACINFCKSLRKALSSSTSEYWSRYSSYSSAFFPSSTSRGLIVIFSRKSGWRRRRPSSLVVHHIKLNQKDNSILKVRTIPPVNKNASNEDPEERETHEWKVDPEAKNQIECEFKKKNVPRIRNDNTAERDDENNIVGKELSTNQLCKKKSKKTISLKIFVRI